MTDNKYKLFRNYMCNELGITRQDIEMWTKEAVAAEVQKKIGQINLDGLIDQKAEFWVRKAVGANDRFDSNGQLLREAIAKELAKELKITLE